MSIAENLDSLCACLCVTPNQVCTVLLCYLHIHKFIINYIYSLAVLSPYESAAHIDQLLTAP